MEEREKRDAASGAYEERIKALEAAFAADQATNDATAAKMRDAADQAAEDEIARIAAELRTIAAENERLKDEMYALAQRHAADSEALTQRHAAELEELAKRHAAEAEELEAMQKRREEDASPLESAKDAASDAKERKTLEKKLEVAMKLVKTLRAKEEEHQMRLEQATARTEIIREAEEAATARCDALKRVAEDAAETAARHEKNAAEANARADVLERKLAAETAAFAAAAAAAAAPPRRVSIESSVAAAAGDGDGEEQFREWRRRATRAERNLRKYHGMMKAAGKHGGVPAVEELAEALEAQRAEAEYEWNRMDALLAEARGEGPAPPPSPPPAGGYGAPPPSPPPSPPPFGGFNNAQQSDGGGEVGQVGSPASPSAASAAAALAAEVRSIYLTVVPIRPRSRGERRSLRTFSPGASPRPPLAFNPDTPRRLSTPLLTPFKSTPISSLVRNDPETEIQLRADLERSKREKDDLDRVATSARNALAVAEKASAATRGELERAREELASAREAKETAERKTREDFEASAAASAAKIATLEEALADAERENASAAATRENESSPRREADVSRSELASEFAAAIARAEEVRSIHWSPYDRVGVVNAVP